MLKRIKELENKRTTGSVTTAELVELWGLYDDWSNYIDNVPTRHIIPQGGNKWPRQKK